MTTYPSYRSSLSFSVVLGTAAAMIVAVVAGCSSSDPVSSTADCHAGDSVSCTCDDGAAGHKACGEATCACGSSAPNADSGSLPPSADAGTATPSDAADASDEAHPHDHDAAPPIVEAGAGSYGADCKTSADCTDAIYNYCFAGGNRSFCTKACSTGAECPVPPTAGMCNMKGYCK